MSERTVNHPPIRRLQAASVRITITTSPQVAQYLEQLVPLGLYGSSVAEVAERIICEGLRADLKRRKQALLEKENP